MNSQKLTSKIELLSGNKRALLFAELSAIAYYRKENAIKQARKLGFTTVDKTLQ